MTPFKFLRFGTPVEAEVQVYERGAADRMAKSDDLVARLSVGSPDGPYSAVFRIWSPADKSDVYAAVREHAGEFKISLHGTGAVDHKGVEWISRPSEGRSVLISCLFSGQLIPDSEWPEKQNGTRCVGTKVMPNGEKFWLLWQDYDQDHRERQPTS